MKSKHYKSERMEELVRRYWDQILVVILMLIYLPLSFACVINFTDITIDKNNILYASSFLTIFTFMTLMMVWFFFIYLGIHSFSRTKTDRVSIELGTQRPQLSHDSMGPHITSTVIIAKFLEDIDVRKAPAPFHYAV